MSLLHLPPAPPNLLSFMRAHTIPSTLHFLHMMNLWFLTCRPSCVVTVFVDSFAVNGILSTSATDFVKTMGGYPPISHCHLVSLCLVPFSPLPMHAHVHYNGPHAPSHTSSLVLLPRTSLTCASCLQFLYTFPPQLPASSRDDFATHWKLDAFTAN